MELNPFWCVSELNEVKRTLIVCADAVLRDLEMSSDKEKDSSMLGSTALGNDQPTGTLDPKIQDAIGRGLKAHFDDLVSAPIPDRFLALLAELEAKEQSNDQ